MDPENIVSSAESARWRSAAMCFGAETFNKIQNSKVLVIGSGGIGCELLKNLVLSGFKTIEIVDLDTIDISNLNRQFLFRRKHVGQPKSVVAKESALLYAFSDSECNIVAHHDDVKTLKYGPEYVKGFDIVLNALDNLSARRHVGRVCWSAGVPYVESGTAGWFGQVQPFIPGVTGCYECEIKPPPTTFPVCTIRSNPSKPIHTIMWAKHLFNLLFGKPDEENAVTDLNKENASNGANGESAAQSKDENHVNLEGEKKSNGEKDEKAEVSAELEKLIAEDSLVLSDKKASGDFAKYIFHKVFSSDILAVNTLTGLWTERAPPKPMTFENVFADATFAVVPASNVAQSGSQPALEDQKLWSIQKCAQVFIDTCEALKKASEAKNGEGLSWDKDEPLHLDFVVAASNLRSSQYGIPLQSKFSIKSDAGNIIPAIATTNAIIAGLIVIEAIKILMAKTDLSKSVYLVQQSRKRSMLMNDSKPYKNPNCYVCSNQFIHVKIDTQAVTLKTFVDEILSKQLGVIDPSVIIGDDIVYEADEDFEHQLSKRLADVKIQHSAIVHVESFAFDFKLEISVQHADAASFEEPQKPYQIVGTPVQPPKATTHDAKPSETEKDDKNSNGDAMNIEAKSNSADSKSEKPKNGEISGEIISLDDDDEDLIVIDDEPSEIKSSKKRSIDDVMPSENGNDEQESEAKRTIISLD